MNSKTSTLQKKIKNLLSNDSLEKITTESLSADENLSTDDNSSFWEETITLVNFFFKNNRPFSKTAMGMLIIEKGYSLKETNVAKLWWYVDELKKLGAIKLIPLKSKDETRGYFIRTQFWKVIYPITGTLKDHKERVKSERPYTNMDTLIWRKKRKK